MFKSLITSSTSRRRVPTIGSVLILVVMPLSGLACSLLVGEGLTDGANNNNNSDAATDAADTGVQSDSNPAVIDAPSQPTSPPIPAEGIYAYVASGKDTISAGPTTSNYGPTASMTIVHTPGAAGCFTATLTLRSKYTEETTYCVRGAELVRNGALRSQFFQVLGGITVSTLIKCANGDVTNVLAPTSDQVWTHLCTGDNAEPQNGNSAFQTGGTYRYMGDAPVTVSGKDVMARHFHEELTVQGKQVGTNVIDWHFAIDTGALVRFVRKVDIDFPDAFHTTYVEAADLTLVSTDPSPVDAGADADASK